MFDISRKGQYKDYYWMIGKCNIALYRAKKSNNKNISDHPLFSSNSTILLQKCTWFRHYINIIVQVSHSPRKNDLAALTSKLTLSILSPKTITVCFRNKQRMCMELRIFISVSIVSSRVTGNIKGGENQ